MKPDQLEAYIATARANMRTDEQIKQELAIGGWDPALIDKTLKAATPERKKDSPLSSTEYTIPEPIFFPSFLLIFVILLVVFNVITYSGQITGAQNAVPVTNSELFGGIIASFLISVILAGIYTGIKKLIRKIRKK